MLNFIKSLLFGNKIRQDNYLKNNREVRKKVLELLNEDLLSSNKFEKFYAHFLDKNLCEDMFTTDREYFNKMLKQQQHIKTALQNQIIKLK